MNSELRTPGSRREPYSELCIWWRAARTFALPASVVPALLGIALAWSEGYRINPLFALLTIVGVIAAHTGANLMNDYVDFKRGVDRAGTQGGSGILVEGILKPRAILNASLFFFVIAAAIAVPLCISTGYRLSWLIIGGFIAGVGYVLPPFRLKYRALGDITVFAAFGVGIALGSYMIQAGVFSWKPVLYAIPIGLLVAAILHANNIRDLIDDRAVSVKTLAGLLGFRGSQIFFSFIVIGSYVILLFFAVDRAVLPGAAVAVFTFPIGWRLVTGVLRATPSDRGALAGVVERTAQLNLLFGLAMIVGIVGWTLLVR